ncbi:MAG: hypothetical protein A2Z11_03115 [Candidatus Woykebacteria bacterium RBG_16_43_9]|uniref:Vitamin K epoxide reductase domain-containing protein n=1 Tax=Candidatus Woykebacteria bacterium RBG_16_43_9 TaxID=1802596 RepID=A0A1G1WFA4_9BACT|nr:MAG: hypothetical protein A2Z11_03115 [Candidatus Woykebacteria bacterium RBG_16_43_9]
MSSNETSKESLFSLPRILIVLISIVGLGIMAYLTYIHYANTKSFCDLSETVSCDVVTTSIYSEIFGFPISIMGLGYFGLTGLLSIFYRKQAFYQLIFLLTLFVLIPSYYFTALEAFVIKAFCILCEASKIIMLAILVTSFVAMKERFGVVLRMAVPVIIAGLVAAGVTYFAQTGNVAQKDYTPFVEALNEKGVVYYKSFKCNNCKRQEAMLGEAYKKLNSVECHPDGISPQVQLCLDKGIKKTPTFLIEEDGIEVKRLEGLKPLEDLAKWAGVPLEKLEE